MGEPKYWADANQPWTQYRSPDTDPSIYTRQVFDKSVQNVWPIHHDDVAHVYPSPPLVYGHGHIPIPEPYHIPIPEPVILEKPVEKA